MVLKEDLEIEELSQFAEEERKILEAAKKLAEAENRKEEEKRLMEGFGAGAAFGEQKGVFCSRPVVELLMSVAETEGIPFQVQLKPGIINDPVEIQPVGRGIHVGYVLVPARYNHSPHEMIAWLDVERTVQMLTAFCLATNAGFLAEADGAI